jgi:hypothetical protein
VLLGEEIGRRQGSCIQPRERVDGFSIAAAFGVTLPYTF